MQALGAMFHDALPDQSKSIINGDTWKGGDIVVMRDKVTWAPHASDIDVNYIFLKCIATRYGKATSGVLRAFKSETAMNQVIF